MRTLIAMLFGATLGLSAAAQPPAPEKKADQNLPDMRSGDVLEPSTLDGAYTIVSGERDEEGDPGGRTQGRDVPFRGSARPSVRTRTATSSSPRLSYSTRTKSRGR